MGRIRIRGGGPKSERKGEKAFRLERGRRGALESRAGGGAAHDGSFEAERRPPGEEDGGRQG